MARRWMHILVAALLATAAVFPEAGSARAAGDPERLRVELRFRADFGLSTDEAFVTQLMSRPEAYSHWPVALTPQERAELDRRFAMEQQMSPMEEFAEQLTNFAGHWIDQPAGGIITLAFTADPELHREALQALVPLGASLQLVRVQFALQELEAVYEQMTQERDALREDGLQLGHLFVDVMENRVVAGVVGLTPENAAALHARYGDIVVPEPSNPVPTSCSSKESCIGPPLRAGISGAPNGTSYRNRCSIAFMIHRSSDEEWLTAGHCAQVIGVVWHHAGYQIGTIEATCWPQCLVFGCRSGR